MLYKRINYFLEVANCLSFTAAANHMYITQQAMTWHISCLEKELGVKLFLRSTRNVILTDAGRILRDEFARINININSAVEKVKDLSNAESISINIGFYQALSFQHIIDPIMNNLHTNFTNVTFHVILDDMLPLRNMLADNQADLIITTAYDWQNWPDVSGHVLNQYSFEIIMSNDNPLAASSNFSFNDLKEQTLYTLPSAGILRKAPSWQNQVPYKNMITLPNVSNVLVNLTYQGGFACFPQKIFERADLEKFFTYPLPFDDAIADLVCIHHSSINNALISALANSVTDLF